MKNTKEFFGVLLSVLICVFLVSIGVWATTTVGDNVSVGGTLTVTKESIFNDVASANHGLIIQNELQVGDGASVAYSRFGIGATGHGLDAANDLLISDDLEVDDDLFVDGIASVTTDLWVDRIYGTLGAGYLAVGDAGTTTHSLASEDDLLVAGKLEVDGTSFFDGIVSVSDANGIRIGGGATITAGTASVSGTCTIGDVYIRSGTAGMDSIISVCDVANEWTPADL